MGKNIKQDVIKSTEIVKNEHDVSTIGIDKRGVVLRSYDDLWKFSQAVYSSKGMCPKHLESAEAVLVAIQMGLEIGLTPMSAIQNIAVINGIPSIFGDAAKALVLASGACEYIKEYYEGTPGTDDFMAVCKSKRKGQDETIETFSVADAKVAKLWTKAGTWQTFPKRMLKFKARG